MNIPRIRSEVLQATTRFALVEAHPTSDGGVFVKAGLQTSVGNMYIVSIYFQEYPNRMPSVWIAIMIAAHIKPRSECSRAERLDAENIVFGVCLLGCDALYERGLISVKNGRIVTASHGSKALRQLLQPYQRRKCPGWTLSKTPYFDWHYERRFAGH